MVGQVPSTLIMGAARTDTSSESMGPAGGQHGRRDQRVAILEYGIDRVGKFAGDVSGPG